MSSVSIIPFGSGSTGNSFYLEIGDHSLLIDLGIGYRKLRDALEKYGRDLSQIEGVFLTHGHYDHIKAAKAVCNHIDCPVYADQSVMYSIRNISAERKILPMGNFEVFPGLTVTKFPVPHDFVQTSGYVFSCADRKVAYVTDCGKMNDTILKQLEGCDVVILESNHDVEMLKHGPYPKQLQARILSRYGHMSNVECAETIETLSKTGTRHFLLAHLSLQNNTPEIALQTARDILENDDVSIYVCPAQGDDLLEY